jgi:transcriptional regulator with XRE-family HTH domain
VILERVIPMPKRFRTRLAELREKSGVSRMRIVREVGIAYTTVHSWENDLLARIDADTVARVMEIVGCKSLDEFLEFVEEDDVKS